MTFKLSDIATKLPIEENSVLDIMIFKLSDIVTKLPTIKQKRTKEKLS